MALFHLLLLVFSTRFVSSAWTCPKDTLNLGPASGSYPENDHTYVPNQECSFKISVKKDNYIQIVLRYKLPLGDSIQVSDDLGFNYSFVNSSIYTTFSSPVDLYIKFNALSGQEGTFFFNWSSNSILSKTGIHDFPVYDLEDQKKGPVSFVTNDDFTYHPYVIYRNTTVLFVSRGSFTSSFDSDLDAKSYLIFSGNVSFPTSDSYLGSLYDVLKNGPMFFSGNDSVIIFKVTQTMGEYCFLFKLASEVEGLDYSIEYMDTVHSVTLNATNKPQAVTVINSNPRYPHVFLRNIWFNSNQNAQLDHLPGSTTPPFEPIASFRPPDLSFEGVMKYVPGVARTFVAYNGIIKIFLDSHPNEINLKKAVKGTTGMIPSMNYPFSKFLQNTSISLFSPESQLEIKFDCLFCYNSFSITAINGTTSVNSAGNYSLTMHQSITIVGNNFTINYPATRDYGLLSFSVEKAVSNKNVFFISAILVFFFSV